MELIKELGRRIQKARKEKGLTQQELADLSHVSLKHVQGCERGVKNPSFEVLRAFCKVLNLSLDSLMNLDLPEDEQAANDMPQNIRTALAKSDVKELHPDYLKKQLEEVKEDLSKSIKTIVASPQEADETVNDFLKRLKQRTEKLNQNIDRNDLAKAIANNTNLSKPEADKMVEQYMNLIDNARLEAAKQIDNLEASLQKAAQEWKEIKHKALVAADKATDAAARSALISFFAILFGAVLCCAAGAYGSRKTQERVDI